MVSEAQVRRVLGHFMAHRGSGLPESKFVESTRTWAWNPDLIWVPAVVEYIMKDANKTNPTSAEKGKKKQKKKEHQQKASRTAQSNNSAL